MSGYAPTIKKLLPTVQTQGLKICKNGKTAFQNLRLLPTPTVRDINGAWDTSKTLNLPSLAKSQLLPTPLANEATKASKTAKQANLHKTFQIGGSSRLNPLFVGEMMGFPSDWTILPFQSGDVKVSKHTEMQ
jgi:hypothetical protein